MNKETIVKDPVSSHSFLIIEHVLHTMSTATDKGTTNEVQLEFAAGVGRILFSFNVKDFSVLHVEYLRTEREHAGIVLRSLTAVYKNGVDSDQEKRLRFGSLRTLAAQFVYRDLSQKPPPL